MNFQQVIAILQQRYPEAPIGNTAVQGQYYDRAVNITDYEEREHGVFVGHGVNGKEMWVYHSDAKNVICCGDKDS